MATLSTRLPVASRRIRRLLATGALGLAGSLALVGLAHPGSAQALDGLSSQINGQLVLDSLRQRLAACPGADTPFNGPQRLGSTVLQRHGIEPNPIQQNQAAIVCLTNQERTAEGLEPLVVNSKLATAARSYSDDMVRRRFYREDHGADLKKRLEQVRYCTGSSSCSFAENIYQDGGSLTPRQVVRVWMDSEPHAANILNPTYTEIGVGSAFGTKSGRPGGTWTQQFGTRS